jgi:hypothetical protein
MTWRPVEKAPALISAFTWASLSCSGWRMRAGSFCRALRTPLSPAACAISWATFSRAMVDLFKPSGCARYY